MGRKKGVFSKIPSHKICRMCKKRKRVSDFQMVYYKARDYYRPHAYCYDCFYTYLKENHVKNRGKHREYVRKRYNESPQRDIALTTKWCKNNKEKVNAQNKVHIAIKKGLLTKQTCEVCGNVKVHAHHPDYSKPLSVRWLCSIHHKAEHLKLK